MKTGLFHKPIIHILLIVIVGLIAYSNTFQTSFHFDDVPNIVKNPIIKDLQLFFDPLKAQEFKDTFHYRALKGRYTGFLTFALNYKLHGLDVTGYHVANLLIHIINALLVYLLTVFSFQTQLLQNSRIRGSSGYIALFSALLFVSHPIQTQAVTYIVQRLASLATLFYLLSLVMYIRARLSSTSALTFTWYAVSLSSAVLAMKTKEIAFTLPITIALYEFMFFRNTIRKRALYLIPILLTMLIIPFSLIGTDKPVGDLIGDLNEATKVQSISRTDYLLTEFRVIVTYIRLIVLPANQNLDYDYPVFRSFFHPEVLLSFMVLSAIFLAGVYILYRFKDSVMPVRLISFGIFWFFITLSVESSVIPLQVIFEHRMYLPSIGIFLAISTILCVAMERLKSRWNGIERAGVTALFLVIAVLTGVTYARNMIWKDEITLWEDVVQKSPDKDRARYNLGFAYQSQGLTDKAMEQYRVTLKITPDYADAHINLGVAYQSQGLTDKAIKQYLIAVKLRPDIPSLYYNFGIAYNKKGLKEKAIEHYKRAIQLDPYYSEAYYNLGNSYVSMGLTDRAIEQYQLAVKYSPDYSEAHNNLANAYRSEGLFDRAIEHYRISIQLKPDNPEVHYNLGVAYGSQGIFKKATEHFQTAIQLRQDYTEAHYNLGVAYGFRGFFDRAEEQYLIAIRLNPDLFKAYYNLGAVYYSQGLLDKAIEMYKTAINLDPGPEKPYFKLGRIYLEKGDREKALREFEKALQVNPLHEEARKLLRSIKKEKHLL